MLVGSYEVLQRLDAVATGVPREQLARAKELNPLGLQPAPLHVLDLEDKLRFVVLGDGGLAVALVWKRGRTIDYGAGQRGINEEALGN